MPKYNAYAREKKRKTFYIWFAKVQLTGNSFINLGSEL